MPVLCLKEWTPDRDIILVFEPTAVTEFQWAPLLGLERVGGEPLLSDAWPVRRQTYGYLPSLRWYEIYTAL